MDAIHAVDARAHGLVRRSSVVELDTARSGIHVRGAHLRFASLAEVDLRRAQKHESTEDRQRSCDDADPKALASCGTKPIRWQ